MGRDPSPLPLRGKWVLQKSQRTLAPPTLGFRPPPSSSRDLPKRKFRVLTGERTNKKIGHTKETTSK